LKSSANTPGVSRFNQYREIAESGSGIVLVTRGFQLQPDGRGPREPREIVVASLKRYGIEGLINTVRERTDDAARRSERRGGSTGR